MTAQAAIEEHIDLKAMARPLGITQVELRNQLAESDGPVPLKLGPNTWRLPVSEAKEWLKTRRASHGPSGAIWLQ